MDKRVLHFQNWQSADYTIEYNDSQPIARVELTIMEVYDNLTYPVSYIHDPHVNDAGDNFGGFSEIYWYLEDESTDPSDIVTSYYGIVSEDNICLSDLKNTQSIDSGNYYNDPLENTNDIGIAFLSGLINLGVSKNKVETNERYSLYQEAPITGSNVVFNSDLTRNYRDAINRAIAMFWMDVSLNVLLFAITSGVINSLKTIGANAVRNWFVKDVALHSAKAALVGGFKSALKVGAILSLTQITLSSTSPTLAKILTIYIDMPDRGWAALIYLLASIIDILPGMDNSIAWLGPILYGTYKMTLDIRGTVPRLANWGIKDILLGSKDAEWGVNIRSMYFMEYENAILSGTDYDWNDYWSDLGP